VSGVRAQVAQLFDESRSIYRLTRLWLIVLLITAPTLAICGTLFAVNWPYRYRKIHPMLEDMFGNQVKIGGYHRTYFPQPGFMATNLVLTRKTGNGRAPLGTIETLSVDGKWSDLFMFRNRVRMVEITGLHLLIPAPGGGHQGSNVDEFEGPEAPIEHLRMHNSLLDILRDNGGRYTFAIRNLEIGGLQRGHPWHYSVDMENPLPAGHIAAEGDFGPLDGKNLGATPVSGRFTFNHVKLSDIGILHGTLGSAGHFNGPLGALQADASSDTPDFAVDDGMPTPIRGSIHCIVNGLNGDVTMQRVEVTTGRTIVRASGQVAGSPKLTNLDIYVEKGRAEELLRPFVHHKIPIVGPASLHSHAFIAASGPPFLERLHLESRFVAPAEKPTDRETEKGLSDFSRREKQNADGPKGTPDPPPADADVLSSLEGPASIRKGVIHTSGLVFRVPGATATLHGSFMLHGQSVHLEGALKMDAGISHATTGWKSVLLKPLQPLFHRKDHAGSEIPIAVVGTPGHYRVVQDMSHNK
jgi:hypothetical protein